MAPSYSRQLLIWTVPTVAVLLSYLWYKRKRIGSKSDPGDDIFTGKFIEKSKTENSNNNIDTITRTTTAPSTTRAPFSRSLSGVESAPIDIVIPPKLKAAKSNPIVISDEDLDLEIEKIKSMRYGGCGSIDLRKSNNSSTSGKKKQQQQQQQQQQHKQQENKKSSLPSLPSPPPIMAQKVDEEKTTAIVPKETVKQQQQEEKNTNNSNNTTNKNNNNNNNNERQNGGRDSANHSPPMMASPSLSSISDNHSEGSNDSGKGGSEVVTPPPSRSLGTESAASVAVYEFIIPQSLVGKLIGKHGSSVANIKDKTGAHVVVRKHPTNNKLKVCAVEGTQKEIDSALKLIRDKFPLKRFPEVTLEQVSFLPQVPAALSLVPDYLHLKLIEGINNDTIVSCIVAPDHLFLQQPTHPSFPNLNVLTGFMNACYSEADSPLLPTPILENIVCAAFSGDSWHRALILSIDPETNVCYVKFLDYGGYAWIETSQLRQIRGDFLTLPFQAAECFLANVRPKEETGWREEAYTAVAQMTKGAIIYTQIADYTQDGLPLVNCYLLLGPTHVVFLNQELVNQGYAEWVDYGEEAAGITVA